MSDDLILYTNPMSRGRIARWMLEEVGQPYRTEILHYRASMKEPDFLAVNPMGKVPALRHGDMVVTETAAICAYLADAFPDANLAPPHGSKLRGTYYRWMFFAAAPAEAAITNKALGFEIPEDKQGMCGYGNFGLAMDTLESAIGTGPYLLGEQFTAADVVFGSQINFGLMFGTIEKRPAFETYLGRLTARPAFKKASGIDDALIAEAKQAS